MIIVDTDDALLPVKVKRLYKALESVLRLHQYCSLWLLFQSGALLQQEIRTRFWVGFAAADRDHAWTMIRSTLPEKSGSEILKQIMV